MSGLEVNCPPHIAIVGGGASGVLLAWNLARQASRPVVTLIDPADEPGLGLAYATPCLRHLLNVRNDGMSATPDAPHHFLAWLRVHVDPQARADGFTPRAIFGRYLRALYAAANPTHLRGQIVDYHAEDRGGRLTLADGRLLRADAIVLATGNFDPAPLAAVSDAARAAGVYHHNAWDDAFYDGIGPDDPVALIGTGLTAVDVMLRLRDGGHRGTITAVSRHGLLPNRHAPCETDGTPPFADDVMPTARAYLRAFRTALRRHMPWRAIVDGLRSRTNDLWMALPETEQRRFRRHLQRRWDILRHRIAPPVAIAIDAERAAGTLVIRKGYVDGVTMEDGQPVVTLRTLQGPVSVRAAHVVNCTGPDMNYRRVASPLLRSLLARQIVMPGRLGGGLICDRDGALVDGRGQVSDRLFTLGPARLGVLFESIAIPEIRRQAADLATTLTRRRTDTAGTA
ncbi:FAD/NAD(P)-binding protein [Gluconacetobacter tumulisoli]|uniref:NAD(P)-binding protein n=1 Tax=Gluconacetobacter tumulisoli TaxID=1286189 RepID=A0A7W4PLC2_9PROT|nr:FAD/NAD(P)-binding protein [Gluconacetobacter tumulisoli]MBB2200484.1 NAD(P)-binding protein [Gluconacetobacter tumulisoli]